MNNKKDFSNTHNGVNNQLNEIDGGISHFPTKTTNLSGQPNSYGRPPLQPYEIKEHHDKISGDYVDFFTSKGYIQEPEVGINDKIDDSVYLIGAPISVLKPYLVEGRIPDTGVFMSQDCIRTMNAKTLLDDDSTHKWGSRFTGLATLVNPNDGVKLLEDAINFLIEVLYIPLENIRIHINSKDTDLIDMLTLIDSKIQCIFNSEPDVYYTHKYGLGETVGRNFNFTLREEGTDNFHDIGNFIVIEDKQKIKGYELALGVSVIMKGLYGLNHTMESSSLEEFFSYSIYGNKFQDSIVSSVSLLKAGILPKASNTKGRVLRTYLRGILFFSERYSLDLSFVKSMIDLYEEKEFQENTGVSIFIIDYLLSEKERIKSKNNNFSAEEEQLMLVLK